MGSLCRKLRRHLDGPSKLMDLVDEIARFEVEEIARRKEAAKADSA